MFADLDKVAAIKDVPLPTLVTQLRQVLGMIHYLVNYLPDLHTVTKPLNDLKSDAQWCWGPSQKDIFQSVTKLGSTTPMLTFYDANEQKNPVSTLNETSSLLH